MWCDSFSISANVLLYVGIFNEREEKDYILPYGDVSSSVNTVSIFSYT